MVITTLNWRRCQLEPRAKTVSQIINVLIQLSVYMRKICQYVMSLCKNANKFKKTHTQNFLPLEATHTLQGSVPERGLVRLTICRYQPCNLHLATESDRVSRVLFFLKASRPCRSLANQNHATSSAMKQGKVHLRGQVAVCVEKAFLLAMTC